MLSKRIHVQRKRHRAQHAWVFSNEVQRTEGNPGPGDLVLVMERNRLIGSAMYNPHSLIRARLYSARDEELDKELITRRIRAAWEYRQERLPGERDCRLVYGESDHMPGLVVDRYDDHFVVQTYCLAMDLRLELVVEALRELFATTCVFEKNDFRLREPESLPRREGVLYGTPRADVVISESGVRFRVDIAAGQKTGYYFDHRLTRRKVREMARDRSVLDAFCYTGSFAVNAALGGATRVVALDASDSACRMARINAELNGVAERCEFVVADAFRTLAQMGRDGVRFDLVCLDPPAFVKRRQEKDAGLRGYRTINALGMKLLTDGGILVTSSCSHYLFWQDMLDMLVSAAQDAGRTFTILDRSTQGPDHPVLLSMPESEYLRCFVLQVH
ncbi:MAG: class I SAM-dependent rRNA methyltransferase [candidate division WOR-3 bacterium]